MLPPLHLSILILAIRLCTSSQPSYPSLPSRLSSTLHATACSQFSFLNSIPRAFSLFLYHPRLLTSRSLLTFILILLSGDIQPNPGPPQIPATIYSLNIRSLFHQNREAFISDVIHSHNPDVFAFSETWHHPNTTTPLNSLTSPHLATNYFLPRAITSPTLLTLPQAAELPSCAKTL